MYKLESQSPDNRAVVSRPDALFCEREEEANCVANAVEDDDKKIPSWSIRSINIHERIRPVVADASCIERPLEG
jgi:hypothetical protein